MHVVAMVINVLIGSKIIARINNNIENAFTF